LARPRHPPSARFPYTTLFRSLVILNALAEKPLPVYGKGANVRDWLYVEDHARALALIATKGRAGESYNIGGRSERTNLEVVETIDRKSTRLNSSHVKISYAVV